MGDMADRIMEVPLLTSMLSVNSINPMVASASLSVSVTLESLAERVEDLAQQLKLLQTRSSSRALSNSFRRRFSGSPRRNLASQDPNFQLKAANNSIKTYGFLTLPLDLRLRRHFSWQFVIADVPLPIIGSDFLAHYGLLPDCKHKLLLDRITSLSVIGQSTGHSMLSIKIISGESSPCDHILKEYPTLTRPAGTLRNISHSTVHHIRTTPGPPVFCRPRRLAPERMKIAKAEFEAMVLEGAARRLRGAQPLTWTSELDTAFSKCKEALSEVTLLMHPAADVPLGLFTDASACHWPAYYRELFAIYSAVQHFRHVLEAQHCTIYTDHKPITYAFLQHHEKLPPVQLNQLSFIGQFTTDIQHISGADNVVADAFSCISYIAPPPVDLKAIAEAQKGDTELLDLQTSDNTLKLKKSEFLLLNDAEFLMLCMG
ncbi:retrotransposable element Tf2 protein type 1 [Trichonephila inaurata madagascariensis]|uniref:Retrotransposable element Tf2 protein type 1 n=1 Tax=Trichonephila inaurata madagascariensis TaxID=2747483 RepID=A0A8X7BY25_9ARAC|nr:retrotransposable element Tf2 protein type 1 [Trichonephila inaurata madagascariensis]